MLTTWVFFFFFSSLFSWFTVVAIQREERLELGQAGSTKSMRKDAFQALPQLLDFDGQFSPILGT